MRYLSAAMAAAVCSADVVGVDFGTSNTAVALALAGSTPRFATFRLLGDNTPSFRSLLYFDLDDQEPLEPVEYTAGPAAIETYLDTLGDGRLIQSFKSHLASQHLGRTAIGPHTLSLDEMLILFLSRLRREAKRSLDHELRTAVFGRPVRFVGSENTKQDETAEQRLADAARRAGFESVRFELEPIAAAYHYERTLTAPQTVLVADFGGGTSDFCVMRLGPRRHCEVDRRSDILATHGAPVAGDDLDAQIIDHVVAPLLGKGTRYDDGVRRLPIPPSYYHKLAHWHQLSFLKGERTRHELDRLHKLAERPEQIAALRHVIDENQGFHLHKAVERVKIGLSHDDHAEFEYVDGPVEIRRHVQRRDFERWIAPCVAQIAAAADTALELASATPPEIDRVFLTGGTAFVPAVRRWFSDRFGANKLQGGDELMSIASGLAVRGANLG